MLEPGVERYALLSAESVAGLGSASFFAEAFRVPDFLVDPEPLVLVEELARGLRSASFRP